MAWTLLLSLSIAVLCIDAHNITSSTKDAKVIMGDQFDFVCNAREKIESCSIKFENLQKSYNVRDGAETDAYRYLGKGYEHGDCGLSYFNTTPDMQGNVTCKVAFPNDDEEIFEYTKLEIWIPVANVKLEANNNKFEFKENDQMIFNCSTTGLQAVPLPNLTISIGEKERTSSSKKTFVVAEKLATFQDHNTLVQCQAEQSNFNSRKNSSSTKLVVKYKPRLESDEAIDVGEVLDHRFNISARILANPLPSSVDWRINGNQPDKQKYKIHQTSSTSGLRIISTLEILNLTKEVLQAEFTILAKNDIGSLKHAFIPFYNGHEREIEKLRNKTHLANVTIDEAINETQGKADAASTLENYWVVLVVSAILVAIISIAVAFLCICNQADSSRVHMIEDEAQSSFQYLETLDKKESATTATTTA